MSLMKRGLVFVTFCGSCIAVSLLVASLGTKHWVDAKARRLKNPHESDGKINFGLFDGKKELNVAYGWRSYDIDVIDMLRYEQDFLIYGLWLGTVVGVCAGLLFSTMSAIFAAINTTSSSRCRGSNLYVWNIISMLVVLVAIGCWIAQFYLRIMFNILSMEDRDNDWSSEGMTELGYSFWFAVGASILSFLNIIILVIANSDRQVDTVIHVIEEKNNGAIMLY